MSHNGIRKNFVFEKDVATHLEEIAKKQKKSMTAVLKDMIEEKYKEISTQEKLNAFKSVIGTMNGILVDKSIQSIKAQMHE